MTTLLYFYAKATNNPTWGVSNYLGDSLNLAGVATNWYTEYLKLSSAGASASSLTANTVNGPTNGVEVGPGFDWLTDPLAADITISGTITLNLRAAENSMSANVAINAIIERVAGDGTISTILQTNRTTELGTSEAANNFTGTPTSTNMKKGDRIRIRIYGDDSTANMATGFTFTFWYGGASGGSGDSWVQFTENLSFRGGSFTTVSLAYLTDTAGPAVGANVEKEMWQTAGASAKTAIRNSAAGLTAPLQWTDAAGGTPIEWYTKQLQSFTLADYVRLFFNASESNASANLSVYAELAVCDDDGTNAVTWASARYINYGGTPNPVNELLTGGTSGTIFLTGPDTVVNAGQRLRLRLFIDDAFTITMGAGFTATLSYNTDANDTRLEFPVALVQYSAEPTSPARARVVYR